MVKRCQWGLCDSDTRYPDRLKGGVQFIPFPKPKRKLEKCKRWIKACGRPHTQLNVDKINGNYHMFVCTKHFPDEKPTEIYPDPMPAGGGTSTHYLSVRPPPRLRSPADTPEKKRKLYDTKIFKENDISPGKNIVSANVSSRETQTDRQQSFITPSLSPLELLALAAENSSLSAELQHQTLINDKLKHKIAEHTIVYVSTECKLNQEPSKFTTASLRDCHVKDSFRYHTSFTYERFLSVFKFLVPDTSNEPVQFPRRISSIEQLPMQDQLLLSLIKLRLNFEFKHLAFLFKLSPQDVSLVFRTWLNYMFYRFGSVSIWPAREVLYSKMPKKFKEDFPTTFVILDGTEIKIQKPSSLRSQSQCYSDYKSSTTLKGLVGIDPRGSFIFISMLFSGSISDKEITGRSGLLNLLQKLLECGKLKKGDGVMVDKGFLINHEIERLGLKLYIPPFAPGSGQMSAGDVSLTKKIASHRVHVERAISRAKKFKIIDDRMDLSLFGCVNQVWFCCCFLTEFMPLLIQDLDNKS